MFSEISGSRVIFSGNFKVRAEVKGSSRSVVNFFFNTVLIKTTGILKR